MEREMQYNNLFTTRQSRAKPSTKGGCSVHIKQIMPQLCEIKSQNEDP
jgi:hypothetical protein